MSGHHPWPPPSRSPLRKFIHHVRKGLGFGYPLCCCVRWSAATARGVGGQAVARGVCKTEHGQFVPCNVFHRAEHAWPEWERLLVARGEDV